METVIKTITFLILTLPVSCRKWDPDYQFSKEISEAKKVNVKQKSFVDEVHIIDLKVGQSLSEVLNIIGNNYKILANARANGTSWLKIEYQDFATDNALKSSRTELLFKNNQLIKIYHL